MADKREPTPAGDDTPDALARDPSRCQASDLGALAAALSQHTDDTYPTGLDPEAHSWRRTAKVAEEAGEAVAALIGMTGANPRKGVTHSGDEVVQELADVALSALTAIDFHTGNRGDSVDILRALALFCLRRNGVSWSGCD